MPSNTNKTKCFDVFIYQKKRSRFRGGRSADRRGVVGFWNRRGLTRARDNVQDCTAG